MNSKTPKSKEQYDDADLNNYDAFEQPYFPHIDEMGRMMSFESFILEASSHGYRPARVPTYTEYVYFCGCLTSAPMGQAEGFS